MHKIDITAGEIAEIVSGTLIGDPNLKITGLSLPDEVDETAVCFINSKKSIPLLGGRTAGLIMLPKSLKDQFDTPRIFTDKPTKMVMLTLLNHLFPPPKANGKIHPRAVIAESAEVAEGVEVGAGAVIGENAKIGKGTKIYPNVVIGDDVTIGENCLFYPNVTIYFECQVGNRVILHSSVVIGGDGFGYEPEGYTIHKVPQIGNVIIEDDVEVGPCSTIDRSTLGSTHIGAMTKIDNFVMIGHNCKIGRSTIICAHVGIAGGTTLGEGVIIAGMVGIAGHLKIGDRAVIGPSSGVGRNIEPGARMMGPLPYPEKEYYRSLFLFPRLNEFLHRIKRLEGEILEKSQSVSGEKALDHSQTDSL